MSAVLPDINVLSAVNVIHCEVQRVGPFFSSYFKGHQSWQDKDDKLSKSSSDDQLSDLEDFQVDIEFLRSLDPKEWKDQDHYAVLGLKKPRFNASDDDIRRAYRKMVLMHHPDKRKAKGEEINTDDDYFTCITKAYEILGTFKTRRAYDSVDPEFDDSLPTTPDIDKNFYKTFDKYFTLNARWSEKNNVPSLGTAESERQEVDHFYSFWYDFESWREFSYLDEEDKEKGQDREERRWIEKQNKVARVKRKKEEMSRIRALVDLSYNNDPRILKFKQEDKDRKLAAKRAKMDAAQAAKAEEERILKEAQLAKNKAEQAEQKRIEQIRIEKEYQKKALKKERKTLRDKIKENNYFSSNDNDKIKNMEGVEKICETLKLLELQQLNKDLETDDKNVFFKVLKETEKKIELERDVRIPENNNVSVKLVNKNAAWDNENMQLLIKAVNLFPAGTSQRWEIIATFMNQHSQNTIEKKFSAKDVLNKAKDLQGSDFSKSVLKTLVNDSAYESFEKTKKELQKIDKNDITINPDNVKVTENNSLLKNGGNEVTYDAANNKNNVTSKQPPSKTWTKDEQALLEQAIKTYPISTPDRWDRIAECIPGRSKKDCLKRVKELVERVNAKKEAQQVTYSTHSEIVVDFTRDHELIRQALKKVKHYDKSNFENVLQTVSNLLATNWTQNHCHVLIFTDCGGATSIKNITSNISTVPSSGNSWLKYLSLSKLSFICIGSVNDTYFNQATLIYQQFLDTSRLSGDIFKTISPDTLNEPNNGEINRKGMTELIKTMCDINFKPFEAILKCGSYFKLECPILIWPQPMPHIDKDKLGKEFGRSISRRLEICGFLSLSDIGSPISISRHLIVPRMDTEKCDKKERKSKFHKNEPPANEYEKLENEIRSFYSKSDGNNSEDEDAKSSITFDSTKESICVLLHGALKVENMAALVLLNDNWFGFVYSYADSKKKSNLMLNILPPGNLVIPWLGDLSLLCMKEDLLGENTNFPVKSEKRSYSQNCVVWIKNTALQSDIQKVLRHAKKLPEKTPHFYKELNRIRRAALSLGFVELLDTLACIFERELTSLPQNASPDCAIQLKHSAIELRKITNRDLKNLIVALPTKYNQL